MSTSLKSQDVFDGTDKIGDLRGAVGKVFGEGEWAIKVMWVSNDGETCVVETNGKRTMYDGWYLWNKLFY